MAIAYPSVNIPACCAERPPPTCRSIIDTSSIPATPFNRKFESVAPVYVALRNSAKFTNGSRALVSALRNATPTTTAIATKASVIGFVHPNSLP